MLHRVSACAGLVLAPNPGPMTLEGTNTWVLSAPGPGPEHPNYGQHPSAQGRGEWPGPDVVVVDPGPLDEDHLQAVAATGTVVLILVTHRHGDHTDGIDRLHEITGAPVRAALPEFCRDSGEPLRDGDSVLAAGVSIRVLATPGHTSDSVSFLLHHDSPETILTGDTVLGRGTTMIDHPDGTLEDYLRSLERLGARAGTVGLPAHGAPVPDLQGACAQLAEHRLERLEQVRGVVARLGPDATVEAVTDAVYGDVPPEVRPAAEHSIAAQLAHLRR
ncbi:MBL fold metallo-hydrolase [Kocuria sp.]|uniref:MBL fold metallo-hydrolase n=1 Tax=Kocuria sp. TaxID=1871328 RepID=UPI0026DDB64C|nr:MBL fold metallo-hydrolase [Kocuria sp.]MDO4918131.1 MBL fold metallo-hydrolase [Kocuria sp.]